MKKEIEVLYRLKTPAVRAEAALEGAAKLVGRKKTLDIYFFDPKRPELKPVCGRLFRCFRLRLKDGRAYLTYKVDKFRGDEWLYSDEHETGVADFAVAQDIIRHLGLKELVRVDMVKATYETADYEIAVERVKGLGDFLEVESLHAVADKETSAEKARIRAFVDALGLKVGEEMNAGKPEMLLRKKRASGKAKK